MLINKNIRRLSIIFALTSGLLAPVAKPAAARTVLQNICRVKGQEENVLRGLGLVVGLNGTGESGDAPTMRALARALEVMGSPIPEATLAGAGGIRELEKVKNVALVTVTARVPATGARRGDKLDCMLSAINGKSLAGGRLLSATLLGPNTQDGRVYALAEGPIQLDDDSQPLVGRVHAGCQMEEDVFTPFEQNGHITLVLEKNHANFQTATDVAETISSFYSRQGEGHVRAINAANIVVEIPQKYKDDPVAFISNLMELQIYNSAPEARVVINQRAGSIVISGDVEIGDVVVSHKNIVIEAGETTPAQFQQIDPEKSNPAKLKAMVDALSALKVPHEDMVDIIKSIERNGKLNAQLIIE